MRSSVLHLRYYRSIKQYMHCNDSSVHFVTQSFFCEKWL